MQIANRQSVRVEQRGAVLVLFALLVFGLLGLAALVVDLGMASATQGQMQVAVDGAVLEAMRYRDTTFDCDADYLVDEPFLTEEFRRSNAAEFVRLVFDDDLDPTSDAAGYTVGPVFQMTGGLGDSDASALIEFNPNSGLDDPVLLSNESYATGYNSNAGDMVAGTYLPSAQHVEPGDYDRPDFQRAPSVLPASKADGFLIRLRRTGETPIGGALSSGPAIPYLFGRGSLIGSSDEYSPRKDGIAVRATAIATVQPALQVGVERPAETPGDCRIRGVTTFAIKLEAWNIGAMLNINEPRCADVLTEGELVVGGEVIGSFIEPVNSIGQAITPTPMDPSHHSLPIEGWVPLYHEIQGTMRVVGFGYADLEVPLVFGDPEDPDICTEGQFLLSKRASVVASHNASCVFPQDAVQLSKSEWDAIFEQNKLVIDPLFAAAISR